MFVPDRPFQPSLLFVGKQGAYPRLEHPQMIRLGWKGLTGTDALVYYENS